MLTAGVMSHGGIEFKTKGRDDQAECEAIGPDTFPGKVAGALQIDAFQMIKAYCKPRIKVGTEWVVKGQTCEQVRTFIFDTIDQSCEKRQPMLLVELQEPSSTVSSSG